MIAILFLVMAAKLPTAMTRNSIAIRQATPFRAMSSADETATAICRHLNRLARMFRPP